MDLIDTSVSDGGVGWHDDEQTRLLQGQESWTVADAQDTNNEQEQFEKNVQSMFGIGGQSSSQSEQNAGWSYFDYDPFSATSVTDVNTSSFLIAFYVNAIIFAALICSYELLRRYFPSVFCAKGSTVINTHRLFGWVPGVMNASWSTVRSSGGLDSYMFLRYVRLCFRITFASAIWGMIILWPVYATGDGGAKGWYFLSMANLTQGSNRLWVPAIFMWLHSIYGKLLYNLCMSNTEMSLYANSTIFVNSYIQLCS